MSAERIGPRLTLMQQISRNPDLKGRSLAITVRTPSGNLMRAADAVEGLPHLIAAGILIEIRTPAGNILHASALAGKTPEQIDALAVKIDDLLAIDKLRKTESVKLADQMGIKRVTISEGEFTFQGVSGVRHNGFKITETEFTNGQFRALLERKPEELAKIVGNPKERLEYSLSAVDPDYKHEAEDCPMVGLSQVQYTGIAKLLGLRLLTELEWERAAAGQKGRVFSFGDKFDKNKATFNGKGTRSVNAHRDAATPEGVLDLSGNVYEWTSSTWGDIDLSDPKNPRLPQSGEYGVLRGGSWIYSNPVNLRASSRDNGHPENQDYNVGVRFAED